MSLAITAPAGNIGSRVVRLLLDRGTRPRLLVRNPSKLSPEVRSLADVRQVDLADRSALVEATQGVETLFWMTIGETTSTDPLGGMRRQGENAAEAVKVNGISRIVNISSQGAARRGGDLIGALGDVEDILDATPADIVHLRPGYFYTNLLMNLEMLKQGVLPTTVPLDLSAPWIDPRDIAEAAAEKLLNKEWTGKEVLPLHGPEVLSYSQTAEKAAGVLGRPIQAVLVPEDAVRSALVGMGASAEYADALNALGRRVAAGIVEGPGWTGNRRIESWIADELAPALSGA